MTNERAIEILDPEHREHYDGIEIVNEACRMGMEALKKQIPLRPELEYSDSYGCAACGCLIGSFPKVKGGGYKPDYCECCGQKLDWSEAHDD